VSGYPARAVPSLVFSNPVSRPFAKGAERIREVLASWATLQGRARYIDADIAAEDCAAANGISKEQMMTIMSTPAALGGTGTLPAGTRGLSITTAVFRHSWEFLRKPPLAVRLAETWGVHLLPRLLEGFRNNVEAPPKTPVSVIPFAIKKVDIPPPIIGTVAIAPDSRLPTDARTASGIPASVAKAGLEDAIERRAWAEVPGWLSDRSVGVWSLLERKASRRVAVDWLLGKLPFASPIILGWSTLGVSRTHTVWASAYWEWCLGRSKISYNTVVRAAYTAELKAIEALRTRDVVLCG